MNGVRNWSEAPPDILNLISRRLLSVNDFFNFTCVCKSWHYAVPADPIIPKPPLLMLPHTRTKEEEEKEEVEGGKQREQHRQGFLGFMKGPTGEFINKVFELRLPETFWSRCIGSKGIWVVTIDMELRVRILNLFSRIQFALPSASALALRPPVGNGIKSKKQLRELLFSKVVLSSAPNNRSNLTTDKCIAVGIHDSNLQLWYARPGDTSWTKLQGLDYVEDVVYFKEKLYAVDRSNRLFVCDFGCCPHKITQISKKHAVPSYGLVYKRYLVELSGELALVLRFGEARRTGDKWYFVTLYFVVCTFSFSYGRWIKGTNLGEHSLFLGFNTSVSMLTTRSSTFRANCIYFTEDHHLHYYLLCGFRTEKSQTIADGGHDMGVFDMQKRKVQRVLNEDLVVTSCYSPPVWIIPDIC